MLDPSNADVWARCHGSEMLRDLYPAPPDPDGDTRRTEGTVWHSVVCDTLFGGPPTEGTVRNGVVIDAEMLQSAKLFADDVPEEYQAECDIPANFIDPGKMCRPDVFALMIDCLIVWEGKYGRRLVHPYDSKQLFINAYAVCQMMGITNPDFVIKLRVVQPRAFHPEGPIREWQLTYAALETEIRNTILPAIEAVKSGQAGCQTGSHCGICPARHACTAFQAASYAALDYAESKPTGVPLTGQTLALELKIIRQGLELLKARETGLAKQAEHELRSGGVLPGWKLAPSSAGTLSWSDWVTPEEIKTLGDALGVDLGVKLGVKMLTPKQAIKKGIDDTVISAYAESKQPGLKLTEDDGSEAQRIFGGL